MWLAAEDVAVGTANVWLVLVTLITVSGSILSVLLSNRSLKRNKNETARESAEEQHKVDQEIYERIMHENRRLSNRLEAAEAERDGYRRKWENCEQGRFGGSS